jgi:hypothetical protein
MLEGVRPTTLRFRIEWQMFLYQFVSKLVA